MSRGKTMKPVAVATKAKILVVDDEVAHMRALCDTLRDHGFETVGLASARVALETVKETKFDLLLSDLMMPEMDGIALLQGATKTDPDLVGIIMTGEGTIATAVAAMKSGALDYILKPFKLSAILPVLERALTVRNLRLENARLEREVRERTVALESANHELEAFSYSVSHDLRAPLRHITGFAQILHQSVGASISEEDRHVLERILTSADRMSRLIADLLAFSRTSRAELHRGRVNLQELIESVVAEIQPETAGRNIIWKQGALPEVMADSSLLRQVVSNLLMNAVKYSRPRDPAEIEIGCLPDAKETVIFVRDNGVGFDMSFADRLFGVFQRLHSDQEFEGTGVGLANVRRIIARHSGRTWAESRLGEGATFYFSLPR